MLTMMNASPRASRDLHAAGAANTSGATGATDAYTNPAFSSGGSDQENYAHDAQTFGMRSPQQKPLPPPQALAVQLSMAKSSEPAREDRPEPRAIAVRGLADGNGAGLAVNGGRGGAQNKPPAAGSAPPRREKRSTKSKCSPGLRSGKWTPEEEAFTNTIIHYFKRGLLDIEDGTSLRWYLAKRLNCEAMRVTKKLKGNSSIGKQIFRALENSPENRMAILHAKDELAVLEKHFFASLAAMGQSNDPRPPKPATATSGIKLIGPDGESLQDDANLLLHFFVGAHDEVDPVPATAKSRGLKKSASPADTNLNVQFKLDKKRPFSSVSQAEAAAAPKAPSATMTSDQPAPTVSSPSKRRLVKIEDLMD